MKNKKKIYSDNSSHNRNGTIKKVVEELLTIDHNTRKFSFDEGDLYMPSPKLLEQVIDILRSVLFPGYFGELKNGAVNTSFSIGSAIEKIDFILNDQLSRGISYNCQYEIPSEVCRKQASVLVNNFIQKIPLIRSLLHKDVLACYDGDPAAQSYGEVIFSYPSIKALINYRVAHQLFLMKVPIIPRILTEMAHSTTGIDIHPGARIGESFFMDHGTGIVIGETAIIGDRVRIYQGVTLGAKSFSKNRDGTLKKGNPRHPIIGDDVIIYSGATVLGRISVGEKAIIGGNIWVTEDVKEGARLVQNKPREESFFNGEGI